MFTVHLLTSKTTRMRSSILCIGTIPHRRYRSILGLARVFWGFPSSSKTFSMTMHDYRHSSYYGLREPFREPLTSFPSTSARYGSGVQQQGKGGGPRRPNMKRHGGHNRKHHNRGYQDYQPSLQSLQSANRASMQRHFPRGRFSTRPGFHRTLEANPKVLRSYVSLLQGPGNETPRNAPWDAPDAPRHTESFLYPTPTPGENADTDIWIDMPAPLRLLSSIEHDSPTSSSI